MLGFVSSAVALDENIACSTRGRVGCLNHAGLNTNNKLIRVKMSATDLYVY